jgi:hypothetical protein
MQRVDRGLDHIRRSIKVGLADLQMNNAAPLTLERASFVQYFKGSFGPQPRHPAGELQLVLGGNGSSMAGKTPQKRKRLIIPSP